MGLGILGGGVNTAKWLVKNGAKLTITDLKTSDKLKPSLAQLKHYGKKISYTLGRHKEKDVEFNEIIVVNPDVPLTSPFLKLARDLGKQIENELTLFYKFSPSKKIIAVTGTRGKTTTANWIGHLLKTKYSGVKVAGNSPDNPLLAAISSIKKDALVVIEAPSFLLEHVKINNFRPQIAVITNLFPDHLNRYENIKYYAATKANVFLNQGKGDILIIGCNRKWRNFFLTPKPHPRVADPLSRKEVSKYINVREFVKKWGRHNLANFQVAVAVAQNFGTGEDLIRKAAGSLPQIKFRQELVFNGSNLKIYNDTSATSPEAAMAAIDRFTGAGNLVLIAGGTDRNLEFRPLAEKIREKIKKENLILLEGSATLKLAKELGWEGNVTLPSLADCFERALKIARGCKGVSTILFSPGAKSFEKFKNEFDRGNQFNDLVKKMKK